MKKFFSIIAFIVLIFAISSTAFAEEPEVIASGYCGAEADGKNVVWTFDSDGILTFSGTGAMTDYYKHYVQTVGFITDAPWWIYHDSVKYIVIEDGITYFGAYALNSFGGIAVVKGQPYFGEYSLYMQDGLPSVYFFAGPPSGAHETAYNSIYKMYYLASTEDLWDIQYGYWQGHRMYPYTQPDTVDFDPADFTDSGYCGTDPFISGKEMAWGYDAESKTLTIMGIGNMQNYEPGYFDAPWYKYCETVEKIVVEEGISEIGDYSFFGFSNNKEISLPSTTAKIGNGAFCNAKVSGGFEIPENVESAGEYSFSGFTADWLYIPKKTSLAYSAFHNNRIGEFRVSEDSLIYSVNDGVLMNRNGKHLVCFPGARTGEYSIPEKVEYIERYAFAGLDVEKVFIPKTVQGVWSYSFNECEGKVIFEDATYIENKAFSSRLNGTLSIYFMNGTHNRTSGDFIYKKTNKGVINLYYLKGTRDLWSFKENDVWGGFQFKPFRIDACGDINEDGKINVLDANIIRRYAASLIELDEKQLAAADINGDNLVDVLDAGLVRRYTTKLIEKFPMEILEINSK